MKRKEKNNAIILNISGVDKPGITARLTEIIADENAHFIDLGQSVLNNHLTLSAIVEIPQNSDLLREILFALHKEGFQMEVSPYIDQEKNAEEKPPSSFCITLLGKLGNAQALKEVTQLLAQKSFNIREIKTLSEGFIRGIEFVCEVPSETLRNTQEFEKIQEELFNLSAQHKIDCALQENNIFRRNKRLICFDVDSTFVPGEIIDDLGALTGKEKAVKEITEKAMKGEIDFSQALKDRVALLKGLSVEKALKDLQNKKPMPQTEKLVKILKKMGYKIGLVSGGFDFFVSALKERYQLDFAFANKLKTENGTFTGELEGPILDAHRKAQILKDMSEVYNCSLKQCVAIGDGANDIEMLKSAGLGIAFKAKEKVKECADTQINGNLDDLLYLLGFRTREIRDFLTG